MSEFYGLTDTEKLLGKGTSSENLTDDVMAGSLDELNEIGPKMVLTETAMSIINEYGIPVTSIHADTTSKSVYGDYEGSTEDDEAVYIARPHGINASGKNRTRKPEGSRGVCCCIREKEDLYSNSSIHTRDL